MLAKEIEPATFKIVHELSFINSLNIINNY